MADDREEKDTSQELSELVPSVYQELRSLAYQFFQRERPDHTLQPTALIHEAFLRLRGQKNGKWESREEFIGAAIHMIRRILVDHARRHLAVKRGGGERPSTLDEGAVAAEVKDARIVALDEALMRLGTLDARKSQIIELRFFGGLSEAETGDVLGVSARTVRRDWRLARAWLQRELDGSESDDA